jgi:hypothetical protein
VLFSVPLSVSMTSANHSSKSTLLWLIN